MAKPIKFNAKISKNSKLYYSVYVFETLGEMRDFAVKEAGAGRAYYQDAIGACIHHSYEPDEIKPPKSNKLGVIALCRGKTDSGTIAHECVHAAMGAIDRKGVKSLETSDIGSQNAEELCYITGYLVKQITKRLSIPLT